VFFREGGVLGGGGGGGGVFIGSVGVGGFLVGFVGSPIEKKSALKGGEGKGAEDHNEGQD